ncbi:unnamed protein product [Hermetia illucens]|uniref:ADP-ribosyl cyclase/cyclic ADP-ribose hydrolase n=1 Tax=Hermetia illucens TaxID=343691 RepID=A0A7R8YRL9_HERIL|nr:unnamed protein product [Hermetia illucens]
MVVTRNPPPPNRSRLALPRNYQMSEFPDQTHVNPATAAMLENFHKKSGTLGATTATTTTNTRQNLMNTSSSSSSSVKETSSTSQQVVNSSSTTTRVAKTSSSQRLHHVTSSTSEMKAHALQRDLNDFKNSMSEINDLAINRPKQTLGELKLNDNAAMNQLKQQIRSSLENIVDDPKEPLVTFPNDETPSDDLKLDLTHALPELTNGHLTAGKTTTVDTVKFEEKRMTSASKTEVVTDGFRSEQATSNLAEMKRLQAGDIDYKEAKAAAAMRNRTEMDGIKTEQNAAILKEARSLKSSDVSHNSSNNVAASSIKVQSDSFSAEQRAIAQAQQMQTVSSSGVFNHEQHMSSARNYTIKTQEVCSTGSSMSTSSSQLSSTTMNGNFEKVTFDDLDMLSPSSSPKEIEGTIRKYSTHLHSCIENLRRPEQMKKAPNVLNQINEIIKRAWAVPTYGHELGYSLCNSLRLNGGLDLLMKNCMANDQEVQYSSARLLEQCLTTENRSHVVENGLEKVVNVACVCTKNTKTDHSRVGTGILEHLFKHSEGTCSDVIRLGGLDAVLFECRKNDVETLRHCAGALANLSLYGGAENQEAMINRKVPMWLFPLAFHDDDNIKYYACLAIAVLVANKEIEAEVLKSGTLDLVEPFVTTHDPSEFAKSNLAYAHGQSKHWLQRLVPVLSSKREEARNLAAFHFCMEAGIKKEQGKTDIFREIGAIEPLKNVASCPNAIASKFAAQALRLIGEQVPHKLSQQVPLWSVEDVQEWVKQIGFGEYEQNFYESRVDGDLLLQLNEDNLRDDIGISNGIRRRRFMRELQNLKRMADYSSKDVANLNSFLQNIAAEYCTYTYSMLNAGVDRDSLRHLNEDHLIAECGITNAIHRQRILNSIKNLESTLPSSSEENMAKTLDVFVSYRRSNGSQLASLLKVHLQLRGFSVFIDVERLEAGKFDNNLLNSIRQAKHFILVLTPNALERCSEDHECKDWVHREIVAALTSNCNIIPIIDNFQWPEPEELPEDMRSICHFNAIRWIHDYQDACVDKLERFMRGELNTRPCGPLRGDATPSTPSTASTTRNNPPIYQRMHSNDSGKGSEKDGVNGNGVTTGSSSIQGALNPNKYRKSSSPARQWLTAGTGGSGHNHPARAPRGQLPPYRTQHILNKTMQADCGGRRSSAAGLTHRPPIPPTFNARSHSLDGLLDNEPGKKSEKDLQSTDKVNQKHKEESEETLEVETREKPATTNQTRSSTNHNRKSRSMDDLLDESRDKVELDQDNITKSLENLEVAAGPIITMVDSPSVSPQRELTPSSAEQPCERETIVVKNTPRQSPEGTSSNEDDLDETRSNCSQLSTTSKDTTGGKQNKTFINRAVKKVRSLMKNKTGKNIN